MSSKGKSDVCGWSLFGIYMCGDATPLLLACVQHPCVYANPAVHTSKQDAKYNITRTPDATIAATCYCRMDSQQHKRCSLCCMPAVGRASALYCIHRPKPSSKPPPPPDAHTAANTHTHTRYKALPHRTHTAKPCHPCSTTPHTHTHPHQGNSSHAGSGCLSPSAGPVAS